MPVLVVGGTTPFGHALVDRLLETGGQVRAYVHEPGDAAALRAKGVHVAIGGPLDVERLESACAQVHTVIHLSGPRSGRRSQDETEAFEVTSIAAHAADVVRVVVALPKSGRAASAVRDGIERFGRGRGFELVECVLDDKDATAIDDVLAADARG